MRLQRGGEHHVLKFILVGRSHADDQRQAAQVGDVEQPVVGRTVVGAQAGTVHTEDHRQVLETDIVMDAVIGPLEEGAVNGHHRMEAHGRHAGREDDRVLFSNADVVILAGHCLLQDLKASAARHGRGNANDRFVLLAQLDHRATEDFLPHRSCPVLRRRGLTSGCVVGAQPVEFLRILQRRFVALALLGQHMDDHGLIAGLGELQGAHQQRDIMPIDRSQVTQTEFFKQQRASVTTTAIRIDRVISRLQDERVGDPLEGLLGLGTQHGHLFTAGQPLEPVVEIAGQPVVAGAGREFTQVFGDGTDVLGDGPLIVIENANELLGRALDVVECLETDAVGQGRIAEDADDVLVSLLLVAGGAHAQGGRQRRTGMAGPVAVVFALRPEGEAVEAIGGPDGPESVFSAGQDFVHVHLVTDIPDKLVFGCLEDPVQGDGEFNDAEVGA